MILTNRLFTRREPVKEAKSVYIFCEGKKREYQYFRYFQGIDSRINIVIHELDSHENNSPTGLYQLAVRHLIKSDDNPNPPFELWDNDEVWFVIDTDAWALKTTELRSFCQTRPNWNIAQSNPCFEVWLYFHFFDSRATFQWLEICDAWKQYLSQTIPGGFNSNKHPIFIGAAIENAGRQFISENGGPAVGCSEVFLLAKMIFEFCGKKIERIRNRI
ncbi:MAG: RloB domain-containing protein [Saprospiraceae bacterium]|nr:RloB domain-containing protein [Saprospiraceae bacterium]